jgi:hypothetical protein
LQCIENECFVFWHILGNTIGNNENLKPKKMKTITTIFISIIALVATANANNSIEITNATVATTTLNSGNNNHTVVLNWSAASSSNNSRFEIERSFYSNQFTTIATMQVAFVNSSNFRINDNAAELAGRKIAYYRVKQIAADGTVTYSNTTVVNLTVNAAAAASKNTVIAFTATQNGHAVISIMSTTGKTAAVKNTLAARGNNTVELDTINGLSKGIYTAVITVNGVVVSTQKVIAE